MTKSNKNFPLNPSWYVFSLLFLWTAGVERPTHAMDQTLFAIISAEKKQFNKNWKLVQCQLDWRRALECSTLTSGKFDDESLFVFLLPLLDCRSRNVLNNLEMRTKSIRMRASERAREQRERDLWIVELIPLEFVYSLFHGRVLWCAIYSISCERDILQIYFHPICTFSFERKKWIQNIFRITMPH